MLDAPPPRARRRRRRGRARARRRRRHAARDEGGSGSPSSPSSSSGSSSDGDGSGGWGARSDARVSVKLADFGNAIALDEQALYHDRFGLQTLSYRAPEVTAFRRRRARAGRVSSPPAWRLRP